MTDLTPPAKLLGALRPRPVAVGESGCPVLRLDDARGRPRAYLKGGAGALAAAVIDEHDRLGWLADRLPAPRVLGFAARPGEAWLKTSVVAGSSARDLLAAGALDPGALVDELAAFVARIHAPPASDCPFAMPLASRLAAAQRRIDAGLIQTEDFEPEWRGRSAEDVWRAIQVDLPLTEDLAVTQGDPSLDNLLFEGQRVAGCIDVGGLAVADRHQDLAIRWADLAEFGANLQARFLEAYGLDFINEKKLYVYKLLNELF